MEWMFLFKLCVRIYYQQNVFNQNWPAKKPLRWEYEDTSPKLRATIFYAQYDRVLLHQSERIKMFAVPSYFDVLAVKKYKHLAPIENQFHQIGQTRFFENYINYSIFFFLCPNRLSITTIFILSAYYWNLLFLLRNEFLIANCRCFQLGTLLNGHTVFIRRLNYWCIKA